MRAHHRFTRKVRARARPFDLSTASATGALAFLSLVPRPRDPSTRTTLPIRRTRAVGTIMPLCGGFGDEKPVDDELREVLKLVRL